MSNPVEFSGFYNVLNAVRQGQSEKKAELKAILKGYESLAQCDSFLDELGQIFIGVGIKELYIYSGSEDIEFIGNIDASGWEEMANEKKADLPPYLANSMITFAKENQIPKKMSEKWSVSRREVNKNIMPMARYICEGILDAIE